MEIAPSPDEQPPGAYSFDVFDTCVTRMYAHPRDLFYELGHRLAPIGFNERERERFAAHFQSLRVRAENLAHRYARPRRTVTIEEIYQYLPIPHVLSVRTKDLIRAEIELERESIYPVPAVVSFIDSLRRAGNRVIFISDMYLPSAVLRPMLMENGVMEKGDVLYVSCDVGLTKRHGQLFRHVLDTQKLMPSQLIHTGDNLLADIKMATNAQIRVNHLLHGMLTPREISMASRRIPGVRGNSFLAAFARRLRLSEAPRAENQDETMNHIVRGVITPLLLAYVMWVLDQARSNGIQRLYFVARDGEVLYRIAQVLRAGSSIDLRYLYGSRRSWLPPSIDVGNADWQRLLVIPGQACSPRDIVERMGLDRASQEAIRGSSLCDPAAWSTPLSQDQAHAFLRELMENEVISRLVVSSATQKREAALSYFMQEGLLDDVSWALVDAGWSLNSQASLKRILESGGRHVVPKGFYLALARDHLSKAQAGVAYPFVPVVGSIFSRRRVIVEHCFLTSTHTTTNGYRMEGGRSLPLFGTELRSETELDYARSLHETVVTAAELIAADRNLASALNAHVDEILSNAERLLRHPSAAEAQAMSVLGAVADMRHETAFVKPLCHPLGLKDVWTVISMVLSREKNFASPSYMWLEGSAALSPWYVRTPLALILFVDACRNRTKASTR